VDKTEKATARSAVGAALGELKKLKKSNSLLCVAQLLENRDWRQYGILSHGCSAIAIVQCQFCILNFVF
jgi:hypothetical protein